MVNRRNVNSKSREKRLALSEKKLYVNEAMAHVKNENYHKAMCLLNQVGENIVDPRSVCTILHNNKPTPNFKAWSLELSQIIVHSFARTFRMLPQALNLEPNDRNALIARSKCHLLLGEPQKALQDAENALKYKMKSANMAKAMYCKAEALYHLGDYEMSLVYYYRGMRIRPEYGQFRLGVQKSKDAIKNVLHKDSTINV